MDALFAHLSRTPAEQERFLASMRVHHMRRQAEAKHAAAHAPLRHLVKTLTGVRL
jgi:hypothetical protein